MLPRRTLSIVASLGLVALAPVAATANDTSFGSAPVSVSACDTDTTIATESPYAVPRLSSNLHYGFVNNAGVAAQTVTLNVSSNGQSSNIIERGTFSPGVRIDRDVDAYANTFSGPVTCRVTQVNFATERPGMQQAKRK
jgi:hypothetical protein